MTLKRSINNILTFPNDGRTLVAEQFKLETLLLPHNAMPMKYTAPLFNRSPDSVVFVLHEENVIIMCVVFRCQSLLQF